jgi:hypothetical protein
MGLTVTASYSAFRFYHDEWISCSHWGMFPARRASPNSCDEARAVSQGTPR